ncbi:uncharacterized protein EAF02_011150 [Botrytis sinoallii]|uniref:uncharacterized protein n=1 Tax=Botrytis sinoallii TaxID=1463999 RepID=UPI0019005803|nr:uncharacterized protein EAF02_011150 [Botrytis sinoallii]KAF7857783.1 hypothetical protein EAF02_011150 [Botrytis sinoallii]
MTLCRSGEHTLWFQISSYPGIGSPVVPGHLLIQREAVFLGAPVPSAYAHTLRQGKLANMHY